MLKAVAYLNGVLAIAYFLLYLLNSNSYTMAGILIVFVFAAVVIRSEERKAKFSPLHYILGVASLTFAGFLLVWVFNVVKSSIEHQYFDNSWLYIVLTTVFILSILLQFICMCVTDRIRTEV
jgi:protein-S-isoprenylcysteine O-methyltransferase Ste14